MIESLFQIQILHSYFSDGVFQECRVVADQDTQEIIRRYALVARMAGGTFSLSAFSHGDTPGFVGYLADRLQGEPLRFLLTGDAEQFSSITDVPFDWVGQVVLSSKSGVPDGERIQLAPTLSDRIVERQNAIGVIAIYLDDLLARGGRDVRYVAHFRARSMPWRYYLINRSQTKLNNPVIRNEQYVFDGPEPVVLPNGSRGLCFSSGDRQFPLQQIPTLAFDLIDRLPSSLPADGASFEHCLIRGLPTPQEGALNRAAANQNLFSAMYVYL